MYIYIYIYQVVQAFFVHLSTIFFRVEFEKKGIDNRIVIELSMDFAFGFC